MNESKLAMRERQVLQRLADGDTIRHVWVAPDGEACQLMDARRGVGTMTVHRLANRGFIRRVPPAAPHPGLWYYEITESGRAALEGAADG